MPCVPCVSGDYLSFLSAVQLFPIAAQDFRSWILRGVDEQLRDALMAAEPGEVNLGLFNLFARYVLANFSDQIKIYR